MSKNLLMLVVTVACIATALLIATLIATWDVFTGTPAHIILFSLIGLSALATLAGAAKLLEIAAHSGFSVLDRLADFVFGVIERRQNLETVRLHQQFIQVDQSHYLTHVKGEMQLLSVVSSHPRAAQPGTQVREEKQKQLPAGTLPSQVRYEDIAGQIPEGHAVLGVGRNGIETCDFSALMTMWICGGSSTGKSNTVALKIDEAIRNGRDIKLVVIDPHARKEDSLYNKIKCYEDRFLFKVAITEEESFAVLTWFHREFKRRLAAGGSDTDILLVVDEVSNVVASEDERIKPLIKEIARICGNESRGFGMFGWFISQRAAHLAWLRNVVITVIAHKQLQMSERKLAANEDLAIARDMDNWPRGRVVVHGIEFAPTVLQMPLFTPPVVEGTARELPLPDEMEELQVRQDEQDTEDDLMIVDEDLREAYEAYQNGATGPRALKRELGSTYYQAQKLFTQLQEKGLIEVID